MTTLAFAVGYGSCTQVGARSEPELAIALAKLLSEHLLPGERVTAKAGAVVVVLPRKRWRRRRAGQVLAELYRLADAAELGGDRLLVGTGMSNYWGVSGVRRASQNAFTSLAAGDQMPLPDLALNRRGARVSTLHTSWQVVATYLLTFALPLGFYFAVGEDRGSRLAATVVSVLSISIMVMALTVWAEALASIRPIRSGPAPQRAPAASAIVAAYLPNEDETVVETLRALLEQRYRGDLQVILAYNTPHPVPIEAQLLELADANERLRVVRVEGSRSKAENVNAVLPLVTGEFVGIFDADHQVQPDAFERASHWMAADVDVVQGRCAVRNGKESWLSTVVACEFENIYGVSHPGRQRLYGFGVFGGSNGYWRTSVLRQVRLRPAYLTEDIDSSIRAVRDGMRIVNDPNIVSWELAPTRLGALWKQRLRWAQGWLQVSCRHFHGLLTSRGLGLQKRIGIFMLLGWREVFPWLSALVLPSLLFLAIAGEVGQISMLGIAGLAFTLLVGPVQTVIAWSRALPATKRRWGAWLFFALVSPIYQEWRNLVMRVSVLKQLRGERHWAVTPRTFAPESLGTEALGAGSFPISQPNLSAAVPELLAPGAAAGGPAAAGEPGPIAPAAIALGSVRLDATGPMKSGSESVTRA